MFCDVYKIHFSIHWILIRFDRENFLYWIHSLVAKNFVETSRMIYFFDRYPIFFKLNVLLFKLICFVCPNHYDYVKCLSRKRLKLRFKFKIPQKYPRKPVTFLHPPLRKSVLGSHSPVSRLSHVYDQYIKQLDIFGMTFQLFKNRVNNFAIH